MAITVLDRSKAEYVRLQDRARAVFSSPDGAWPVPRFPKPPADHVPPEEFVRLLADAVFDTYHYLRHPYAVRLVRGELPREELQAWVKVNYPFLVQTVRNDAMIVAKARDLAEMRKQMQVLIDEAGNDLAGGDTPAHAMLWVEFGAALGLSEEEIVRAPVHPLIDALLSTEMLDGLLRPVGAAPTNLRLGERAKSAIIPLWRDALARHYGVPDAALRFFDEHGEADWGHGGVGEEIVMTRCGTLEQQRQLWESARRSNVRQFARFDAWQLAIRWLLDSDS
jgi:pyrroloquinoline quinone (PQQ) biosynthesis protein C